MYRRIRAVLQLPSRSVHGEWLLQHDQNDKPKRQAEQRAPDDPARWVEIVMPHRHLTARDVIEQAPRHRRHLQEWPIHMERDRPPSLAEAQGRAQGDERACLPSHHCRLHLDVRRGRGTVRGQRVDESTGTNDRKFAEEARAARENELYRSAIHGTKPQLTFVAAAVAYLEDQPRAECIKRCVGRLVAHFGPRTLCGLIDQEAIDAAGKALCRATSKPGTRHRQVVTPASAVLNFAAARGRCEPRKFVAPKAGGKRTDWLTPTEAEAMIAGASEHFRPLLTFLFCTGDRLGEVLDLEWANVNLQYCRAIFLGEKDDGGRGTKSGSDRIVDLPPRALCALANLPGDRVGRVFRRPDGEAYRSTNDTKAGASGGQIKRAFTTALKNASLGRRLAPHHCRHSWATWHYCLNRDPYRLRDDGGWRSVTMTERYAKVAPPTMQPEVLAFLGLSATESVQSPRELHRLASEIGIDIKVHHLPPGTSKWNKACPREGARGFAHLIAVPFRSPCLDGSRGNAPCRAGR